DGRHRAAELHVRDADEELRLDVVLRLAVDLREETERLLVLAIAVLEATEQVIELPVEIALVRVVELGDLLVVVTTDALDDVGGLRKIGGELRQPEERFVELQVIRL